MDIVVVDGYFSLPLSLKFQFEVTLVSWEIFLQSTIVKTPFRWPLSLVESTFLYCKFWSRRPSSDLSKGLLSPSLTTCKSKRMQTSFGLAFQALISPPATPAASQGFQMPRFHWEVATFPTPSSPWGPKYASQLEASVSRMCANTILALGSRSPRYPHASPSNSEILGFEGSVSSSLSQFLAPQCYNQATWSFSHLTLVLSAFCFRPKTLKLLAIEDSEPYGHRLHMPSLPEF